MTTSEVLSKYKKVFFGSCHAIGLRNRGEKDNHVCFEILVGDDDSWVISKYGASAYWIPGLIGILQEANDWLKANAEPHILNNIQYGYMFKD